MPSDSETDLQRRKPGIGLTRPEIALLPCAR